MSEKIEIELEDIHAFHVSEAQRAHHTSWGFDPETQTYIFVLNNEDDSVLAAASYGIDVWKEVFNRLLDLDDGYQLRKRG